jgi:hypothetical protein
VPTRAFIQAVRRNPERFPADFMFRLATVEAAALRSQTVISNIGRGGRRYFVKFVKHRFGVPAQ